MSSLVAKCAGNNYGETKSLGNAVNRSEIQYFQTLAVYCHSQYYF